MGRYYYGDIEGKFWFAIQSSGAADRFGYIGRYHKKTNSVTYAFTKKHIKKVEQELKNMESKSLRDLEHVDKFFEHKDCYSDKEALEEFGEDYKKILSESADYHLGKQILTCLLEKGVCIFEGEC